VSWLDDVVQPLLGAGDLEDLEDRPLPEIRALRNHCQQVENSVSFLRRLVQGRLDLLHAVLDHRDDGSLGADLASLLDELPAILAAGPPRPGTARQAMLVEPSPEDQRQLVAELDAVVPAAALATLEESTDEELRADAARLAELEAELSAARRALHERIDRLEREIVSRYKRGEASADELLA